MSVVEEAVLDDLCADLAIGVADSP
jgi:hypothetical protein